MHCCGGTNPWGEVDKLTHLRGICLLIKSSLLLLCLFKVCQRLQNIPGVHPQKNKQVFNYFIIYFQEYDEWIKGLKG